MNGVCTHEKTSYVPKVLNKYSSKSWMECFLDKMFTKHQKLTPGEVPLQIISSLMAFKN